MELVGIREDVSRPAGVVLRIDGYEFRTTIVAPFNAKREAELDWYFEEHLRFPFTDQVRAQEAAASITVYGEKLFKQLIGSDDAREAYGKLKDRAYPDKLSLEVIGSPAFQRFHWEALKDPRLPRPFAFDVPIVRRGMAAAPTLEARAADSPTLNLLVVTARPGEARDVGYRTITRPLVATLRQTSLRVAVDFVRPGTWRALVERLESATRDKGAGHYHAVHFDLHGALLAHSTFSQMERSSLANKVTFRGRWGRDDIPAYQGIKAFLFFEQPEGTGPDLAEAGEVSALLLKHRIPICVLNACQSGKQVGEAETSLGARLLEAGVQSVLAMAWSVTVSAAERLIPVFYKELFDGRLLRNAVLAGRRALWAEKERRAEFNETIDLEDWLLPVVYQNHEPQFTYRDFTREESIRWLDWLTARSSPPKTEYGFFGRDLDVLRIEKLLLSKRNLLLVQGMGGSGKSTLFRDLAHWWELTGLVERSFYFGWDERAWTRAQILRELAPHVLPSDLQGIFDTMPEAAQQQAVVVAMRARRHLLILDNIESVTAAPLAIPHSLNAAQQQELHAFLTALTGGKTLVLLGSRTDEAWLAPATYIDNVHQLEGLDPEAASDLADAVLQRVGAQARRAELAFKDLMRLLSGYPLALQVVLPHLAEKSAADVLGELRQGLARVDVAAGADPVLAHTRSLMACIDYSHGHLDPEAQALLLCFAPFLGAIDTGFVDLYRKTLASEPGLADLPLARLGEVLENARKLGLLQRDPSWPGVLRPQPALGWFLTSRLASDGDGERRRAVERGFQKFYYDVVARGFLKLQISSNLEDRQFAQAIVEREYANLGTALRLALEQQSSVMIYFVLSKHLDVLRDFERGLELAGLVLAHLDQSPPEALEGQRGAELVAIFEAIARRQLQLKQFDSAAETAAKGMALLDRVSGLDERLVARGRAPFLGQLGEAALEQRRFTDAEAALERALEIYTLHDDIEATGNIHHLLGRIAEEQRRFADADVAFKKALDIALSCGNHDEAASVYHHLGRIAEAQDKFGDAEAAFKSAYDIHMAFNDDHGAADSVLHLGNVLLRQSRFDDAETAHKRALEIYLKYDDRHSAARTYHQLGMDVERQNRLAEAGAAYIKALDIKLALKDERGAASTYVALGNVALKQRRFEAADDSYKQALKRFLEFDDLYRAAATYHNIGMVAEGRCQIPEAVNSYIESLKIFVTFDGRDGNFLVLRKLAGIWRETGDESVVTAVGRILCAERNEVLALFQDTSKTPPSSGIV